MTKTRRAELEAELLKTMDELDQLKVDEIEARREHREQIRLHQEKILEIRGILSGRSHEQTSIPGTETGSVKPPKAAKKSSPRFPAGYITRWVADDQAKRPPKFVIEATGLDTKKKIIAKYGPNACFELGEPIPKSLSRGDARCSKCRKLASRPGGALTTGGLCWSCHSGAAPRADAEDIAKEPCLDCGVPAGDPSPGCDSCDHGKSKARPPNRPTKKFPKGAKDLAEVCTKCSRTLGEHAGTKCPPPAEPKAITDLVGTREDAIEAHEERIANGVRP